MLTEKQTLTKAEREELVAHLEQCLAVFTRKGAMLTVAELQLKAMLWTVYRQLSPPVPKGSNPPVSNSSA